jgi:hypothetical protein
VVLTRLINNDGTVDIPDGTLGLTLVNIQEETDLKVQVPTIKNAAGKILRVNPEIRLNLFILVSARFTTYKTGLKYLSAALGYFQANPVMTPQSAPELDSDIEKVSFELYSLNFEQLNHLFGTLGAKYLPSVLYKARMLVVQEEIAHGEQEPIMKIRMTSGGME